MKTITTLALTLALAASPLSLAAAQPSDAAAPSARSGLCEGHRGHRGERHGDPAARASHHAARLTEALGLTQVQSTAVQNILIAASSEFESIHQLAPEERRAAMEAHRTDIDAQINVLLTPDQRTRFDELKGSHGSERRGRRHHRADHGAPDSEGTTAR